MKFKYIGERTLTFTNLNGKSLKAVPGQTYDLDADPNDPRFSAGRAPATASSTAKAVEPPAVSEGEPPSSPSESLTVSETE